MTGDEVEYEPNLTLRTAVNEPSEPRKNSCNEPSVVTA